MRKLRCLDLFCGAGGAARGLQHAGFDVIGVDIEPQPRYAGDRFLQYDVMTLDWGALEWMEYDLIWASPPCQRYSRLTPPAYREHHPDLLPVLLTHLRVQSIPYIVENVPGTEHFMCDPVFLCGTMFGLPFWRHRWFEIGPDAVRRQVFFLLSPCNHSEVPVLISGRSRRRVQGHRSKEPSVAARASAMGIDWMTGEELGQAVPPAYSQYLGKRLMEAWFCGNNEYVSRCGGSDDGSSVYVIGDHQPDA
jgi:DNA (cytosine-5)-methyltransferase 1